MNNAVLALAVSGSNLYAGGQFTTAGGKVSAYMARAIVNPQSWPSKGTATAATSSASAASLAPPTGCSAPPA